MITDPSTLSMEEDSSTWLAARPRWQWAYSIECWTKKPAATRSRLPTSSEILMRRVRWESRSSKSKRDHRKRKEHASSRPSPAEEMRGPVIELNFRVLIFVRAHLHKAASHFLSLLLTVQSRTDKQQTELNIKGQSKGDFRRIQFPCALL